MVFVNSVSVFQYHKCDSDVDCGTFALTFRTTDSHRIFEFGWGDDVESRRGEMGYIIMLHGSSVAWKSKLLQDSVNVSKLKTEWTSMVFSVRHRLFTQETLKGIEISEGAIPWFCDNRGAIQSASKILFRGNTIST